VFGEPITAPVAKGDLVFLISGSGETYPVVMTAEIDLIADGETSIRTKGGDEYTYRIRTVRQGQLKGERIVSLLTGPDNTASYLQFGFVSKVGASGGGTKWKAILWYRFRESAAYHRHADRLNGVLEDVVESRRSARCRRCGRKLTRISSVDGGLGPECAQKVSGA
jgi:hypothetical protein